VTETDDSSYKSLKMWRHRGLAEWKIVWTVFAADKMLSVIDVSGNYSRARGVLQTPKRYKTLKAVSGDAISI